VAVRPAADASLDTSGIVRIVLISAFVVALLLGTTGFYLVLHDRAIHRQTVEAGRLLTTAQAIRNYTDTNVAPALRAAGPDAFHVETVPAFAAQTVYRTVQGVYPGYTYREPALKPTNPGDLPTPFEIGLINKFRNDSNLKELTGTRDDADGRVYYVARPIVAHEPCLVCHDTPQRAPPGMIAKYGPANGFGWKANEVVAIQALTVPAAEELKETGELAMILGGGLLLVFIATYFALTISIDSLVVRPLATLAQAADVASRDGNARALPQSGAREIRNIAAAIDRLRLSLAKAMKRLPAEDPEHKT
jgi:protein-histidine pros-kinase